MENKGNEQLAKSRLVDERAAARHLNIGAVTLRRDRGTDPRWRGGLGIPHVRFGKRVLYDLAVLDKWVNDRFIVPTPVNRGGAPTKRERLEKLVVAGGAA